MDGRSRWLWAACGLLIIVALAGVLLLANGRAFAQAQAPPGPPPPTTGVPGAQPYGPAFPGPMPMPQSAIAANEGFVFVLRGDIVYKIGANDLKVWDTIRLPQPPPPPAPPGGTR